MNWIQNKIKARKERHELIALRNELLNTINELHDISPTDLRFNLTDNAANKINTLDKHAITQSTFYFKIYLKDLKKMKPNERANITLESVMKIRSQEKRIKFIEHMIDSILSTGGRVLSSSELVVPSQMLRELGSPINDLPKSFSIISDIIKCAGSLESLNDSMESLHASIMSDPLSNAKFKKNHFHFKSYEDIDFHP